ncbi:mobilization protein [Acidithiobacillus thiooxidans]|uniref:plasmid mobilization protein n=1 Tax=Acidithiobacillus TaxID=119977 RepID=UPI0009DB3F76|nr:MULTISPECIES: hypothetical protein [Acidithiobacillus]MBU2743161.1 mobilization protein [Acidithiobacillus albertensis]MBU2835020.1 mobilization protein [Acidithiobacillus thiooxidans]MDA8177610.1 hypothetical protein [Acidithiobacillus sp.]
MTDEIQNPIKKRGGRPRLPDDVHRTIRREVWLSPIELADLKAKAAAQGLRVGEYMRLCITDAKLPAPPVPPINLQVWQELARLAANANQYQWAINAGQAHAWDRDLIPQLIKAIRAVRLALLGVEADDD